MKNRKTQTTLKSKIVKSVAVFLALNMFFEYAAPVAAYALTSGPGQPEFSSFEPVGTTDMVDVYTGDFTYNIPLLTVPGPNGGYPINMAYHSGPGMDEEASWCGLGWNINVGAINRQLRGLPDDFNGDDVTHRYHLKPNTTVGMDLNAEAHEIFGFANASAYTQAATWQLYYNNYKGLGYRVSGNIPLMNTPNMQAGLDLSFDSQNGVGVEPDFTVSKTFGRLSVKVKAGVGYNSRQGLVDGSFSTSSNRTYKKNRGDEENPKYGRSGMSSSTSFGVSRDVPSVTMPMRTNTIPFGLHVNPVNGANALGLFDSRFPFSLRGYYSESAVANGGTVISDAYGYMHTNGATADDDLRDFQREPIGYSKKVPNLAPSSFTYDLFSQSGQGTGSQFRSYNTNVGVLSDRRIESENYSYPASVEFGTSGGAALHFGAGFQLQAGHSSSGAWTDVGSLGDVSFSGVLNYTGSGYPTYQAAPFKAFGEKTGVLSSEDHLANWGGDEAVKVKLDKSSDPNWFKRQYVAKNEFVRDETDPNGFSAGSDEKFRNEQRERRAVNYETFTDAQADIYGFTQNIGYTYATGSYNNLGKTFYGGGRADHLSEITSVQPDGMRYTYGLPAYNNVQYDGSFAVPSSLGDFNTKTVAIPIGSGMQPDVAGSYDEFSQQTETGPYVHSWLLTSVVSYDYVDISNDGPSDDDYGYWVRFNYKKTTGDYTWHVPYAGANFYEGNKSDANDDRGSYSCGNREEYYLQSLETKTHIAIFYTSRRQDGVEAESSIHGGTPSSMAAADTLYKLDSIKLYTKAEFYDNIATRHLRTNPVAIKTVHFRYSYDLCGGVFNNTGASVDEFGNSPASAGPNINSNEGKLTLEKVFFTYQTSERGAFSPYLFDYGAGGAGSDDNPDYDATACDRWGQYKDLSDFAAVGNKYPYVDQPWTDQTTTRQNGIDAPVAGAWCLKKVTVPSGSVIDISYEPDEYAYVEDQKAMRMFDIYDLGQYPFTTGNEKRDATTVRTANTESPVELVNGQYRVYFNLEEEVSSTTYSAQTDQSAYITEKYLDNGNVKKIYFSVYMDLLDLGWSQQKDYVKGYAEIDYNNETGHSAPFGMAASPHATGGTFDLGYILLKGEALASPLFPTPPAISPFTRAALDHLHFNRSELVHGSVTAASTVPAQIMNLLNSFSTAATDITQAMISFNGWAYIKGYGKNMDLNGRSVIRLCEPDGRKYGGGSRVHRITVNDNWDNDPGNTVAGVDPDNYSYGIEYNYDIEENGELISSGVCYEPPIGKEENPLVQPIEYTNSTLLHSSENLFLQTPLLESYYPGAQVGYRKVTASSLAPEMAENDDASNHLYHSAAPISVYEFYTPKEFPVIFDQTDLNADPAIVRPVIIPGIYTSFSKRKARSQGYSIVLNDMPGKMRSTSQRTRPTPNNTQGTLITKTEYVFFTEEPFSDHKKNKLSSKVQVLLDDDTYQTATVGQSHDVFIDMNENLETSFGGGLDANLDVSVPILVPTFFPTINKKELSMRTVVVNKIINRTGIVKEIIATHEASTIKTENIAFDIETGQPLLTKTYNEHKDPIYSYSYPGHWYYDALGGGYFNQGMVLNTNNSPGPINVDPNGRIPGIDLFLNGLAPSDCFAPGDDIYITTSGNTYNGRYHIIKVGSTYLDVVARTGLFLNAAAVVQSITVVRSGRDNMQSFSVGSLTSRESDVVQYDPQNGSTLKTSNTSYALNYFLSASAIEFMDIMTTDCIGSCATDNVQEGGVVDPYAIGIRGIWRPLRSYAYLTDRTQVDDIKTDGVFTSFNAFPWTNPASANAAWITASTITKYSPYGFELENKDANGNYSAALFEFRKTLNTAVASNAQYKEIAFESFEDIPNPALRCEEQSDHWGFMDEYVHVTDDRAHTGKQSLFLEDGESVSITSFITDNGCEDFNLGERLVVPDDGDDSVQDTLKPCDCNGFFSPNEDKEYLLMAWVKQEPVGGSTYNELSTFVSPNISVAWFDGVSTLPLVISQVADGPVIDGWQRIYVTFTVPAGAESITVRLENDNGVSSDDYFDDIRIQPFDANMMTYVYDPVTYRLVAQLDANNFATFYIYDEQGGLEKMKLETKEGIKTVKEGRMNMDKH